MYMKIKYFSLVLLMLFSLQSSNTYCEFFALRWCRGANSWFHGNKADEQSSGIMVEEDTTCAPIIWLCTMLGLLRRPAMQQELARTETKLKDLCTEHQKLEERLKVLEEAQVNEQKTMAANTSALDALRKSAAKLL